MGLKTAITPTPHGTPGAPFDVPRPSKVPRKMEHDPIRTGTCSHVPMYFEGLDDSLPDILTRKFRVAALLRCMTSHRKAGRLEGQASIYRPRSAQQAKLGSLWAGFIYNIGS